MAQKISYEARRDLVSGALNQGRGSDYSKRRYVKQTHDDHVIYEDGDTGNHYKASYTISDGQATIGDDHVQVIEHEPQYKPVAPATFSVDTDEVTFSSDGQFVSRYGKVFELGDYPDKNFSLSADEADARLSSFVSAPNDLEHKETILSHSQKPGKPERRLLGSVSQVKRVGNALMGVVTIPKWLHEIHPEPIGVSLAFDRDKRIVGNGLTLNPRVDDAQVAAAFTTFCESTEDTQGDTEQPRKEPRTPMDNKTMFQKFAALFSAAADDATPVDPKDAEIARLRAELEKKPTATFSADDEKPRVEREAKAIAAGYIQAGKAKPAEEAAMVALFTANILADNSGVTAFSADGTVKKGSNLMLATAIYDARPVDPLLVNFTGNESVKIMPAQGAPGAMSAERRAELLAMTDLGREIAKDSK